MFAYPYYQNPPMYAYSPEEYYYHSGNSEASYDSHYGYEDRPKHYRRRSSSTKKPRRSKSFSKMEYEEDEYNNYYNPHLPEDNYYYQGRHRLDGVRSVSPFRENRNYHAQQQYLNSRNEDAAALSTAAAGRRRNTWVQPTSFVNLGQPMINPMTHKYQMQQSLGMCATDTWPGMTTNAYIPANNELFYLPQNVPMIHQPYYLHPLANNSNHPFIPATTSSVASSNASSFYPPHHQQQQQTNLFPNFMPIPALFQELFSQPITMPTAAPDNQQVQQEQEDVPKKEVTPATSQKTSPIINTKEITTDHAQDTAQQKPPVTLRRKKSIMEGLLSSFALLGEEVVVNNAPMNNTIVEQPGDDDKDNDRANLTWDPSSYTSLSEALHNHDTMTTSRKMSLSKKTSTRLSQKANALQNRQYIWCYRPYKQPAMTDQKCSGEVREEESPGLWAAFDMRNQYKLDQQYYFLAANHGNTTTTVVVSDAKHKNVPEVVTDDPEHIVVLNKQASLPGPIMVSIHDHVAWYNKDAQTSDFCLLEIACMPTVYNRLVVSNDLIKQEEAATKTLRRSKSMDGLASKLLNTVLGW